MNDARVAEVTEFLESYRYVKDLENFAPSNVFDFRTIFPLLKGKAKKVYDASSFQYRLLYLDNARLILLSRSADLLGYLNGNDPVPKPVFTAFQKAWETYVASLLDTAALFYVYISRIKEDQKESYLRYFLETCRLLLGYDLEDEKPTSYNLLHGLVVQEDDEDMQSVISLQRTMALRVGNDTTFHSFVNFYDNYRLRKARTVNFVDLPLDYTPLRDVPDDIEVAIREAAEKGRDKVSSLVLLLEELADGINELDPNGPLVDFYNDFDDNPLSIRRAGQLMDEIMVDMAEEFKLRRHLLAKTKGVSVTLNEDAFEALKESYRVDDSVFWFDRIYDVFNRVYAAVVAYMVRKDRQFPMPRLPLKNNASYDKLAGGLLKVLREQKGTDSLAGYKARNTFIKKNKEKFTEFAQKQATLKDIPYNADTYDRELMETYEQYVSFLLGFRGLFDMARSEPFVETKDTITQATINGLYSSIVPLEIRFWMPFPLLIVQGEISNQIRASMRARIKANPYNGKEPIYVSNQEIEAPLQSVFDDFARELAYANDEEELEQLFVMFSETIENVLVEHIRLFRGTSMTEQIWSNRLTAHYTAALAFVSSIVRKVVIPSVAKFEVRTGIKCKKYFKLDGAALPSVISRDPAFYDPNKKFEGYYKSALKEEQRLQEEEEKQRAVLAEEEEEEEEESFEKDPLFQHMLAEPVEEELPFVAPQDDDEFSFVGNLSPSFQQERYQEEGDFDVASLGTPPGLLEGGEEEVPERVQHPKEETPPPKNEGSQDFRELFPSPKPEESTSPVRLSSQGEEASLGSIQTEQEIPFVFGASQATATPEEEERRFPVAEEVEEEEEEEEQQQEEEKVPLVPGREPSSLLSDSPLQGIRPELIRETLAKAQAKEEEEKKRKDEEERAAAEQKRKDEAAVISARAQVSPKAREERSDSPRVTRLQAQVEGKPVPRRRRLVSYPSSDEDDFQGDAGGVVAETQGGEEQVVEQTIPPQAPVAETQAGEEQVVQQTIPPRPPVVEQAVRPPTAPQEPVSTTQAKPVPAKRRMTTTVLSPVEVPASKPPVSSSSSSAAAARPLPTVRSPDPPLIPLLPRGKKPPVSSVAKPIEAPPSVTTSEVSAPKPAVPPPVPVVTGPSSVPPPETKPSASVLRPPSKAKSSQASVPKQPRQPVRKPPAGQKKGRKEDTEEEDIENEESDHESDRLDEDDPFIASDEDYEDFEIRGVTSTLLRQMFKKGGGEDAPKKDLVPIPPLESEPEILYSKLYPVEEKRKARLSQDPVEPSSPPPAIRRRGGRRQRQNVNPVDEDYRRATRVNMRGSYEHIIADSLEIKTIALLDQLQRQLNTLCRNNHELNRFVDLQETGLDMLNQCQDADLNMENVSAVCVDSLSPMNTTKEILLLVSNAVSAYQQKLNENMKSVMASTPKMDPCVEEKDCLSETLKTFERESTDQLDDFASSLVKSFKILPRDAVINTTLTTSCLLPDNKPRPLFAIVYWNVFLVDASHDFFTVLKEYGQVYQGDVNQRETISDATNMVLNIADLKKTISDNIAAPISTYTVYEWLVFVLYRHETIVGSGSIRTQEEIKVKREQYEETNKGKELQSFVDQLDIGSIIKFVNQGGLETFLSVCFHQAQLTKMVERKVQEHVHKYRIESTIAEVGDVPYVDFYKLLGDLNVAMSNENLETHAKKVLRERYTKEYQVTLSMSGPDNTKSSFVAFLQDKLVEMEKNALFGIRFSELSDQNVTKVVKKLRQLKDSLWLTHEDIMNQLSVFCADNVKAPQSTKVLDQIVTMFLYEREPKILFDNQKSDPILYREYMKVFGTRPVILGDGVGVRWLEKPIAPEEDQIFFDYLTFFQFLLEVPSDENTGYARIYEDSFEPLYYLWFCLSQDNNLELLRFIFERSPSVNKTSFGQALSSVLSPDELKSLRETVTLSPPDSYARQYLYIDKYKEVLTREPNWKEKFDGTELVSSYKDKLPMIECKKYKHGLSQAVTEMLELYPEGCCVLCCPYHDIQIQSMLYMFQSPCETISVTYEGIPCKYYKLIKKE